MKRGALQTGITRSRVLELVRQRGEISRIEISRQLSMDRSSITHVVKDLLDSGILREQPGSSPRQSGRKPVLLSLNPGFGSVLALEIQPGLMRTVITDLCFNTLLTEEIRTDTNRPEVAVHNYLISLVMSRYPHLLGISLAMPGIVDPYRGMLIESLSLGLREYPITEIAGYPVVMDNDANCFARTVLSRSTDRERANMICLIAESHRYGKAGLTSRDDIGIGIVINGHIYFGSHFTAGEPGGEPFYPKSLSRISDSEKEDYLNALFKSLENTLYLMDAGSLHIGGELGDFESLAPAVSRLIPPSCSLYFKKGDAFEGARGAAALFLDQLFESSLHGPEENCLEKINWENLL